MQPVTPHAAAGGAVRAAIVGGIAFVVALTTQTQAGSRAQASEGTFTNLGEGLSSCGEWLDKRRANPSRVIPESAWVLGFVTAASQYHVTGRPENIAHGLTGSGVDHWVDNYCATHPLDNIDTAASALVRELAQR
jgi:hypothetical protein